MFEAWWTEINIFYEKCTYTHTYIQITLEKQTSSAATSQLSDITIQMSAAKNSSVIEVWKTQRYEILPEQEKSIRLIKLIRFSQSSVNGKKD